MPEPLSLQLADAEATEHLGAGLANALGSLNETGCCIWFDGPLGAGKTTLIRGLLRALGHAGRVPSPSYTLIEPYELSHWTAHHIDLYRLQEPGEAANLGLDELTGPARLVLIEWPEQGGNHVPSADLRVRLSLDGAGRKAVLAAVSATGARLVEQL